MKSAFAVLYRPGPAWNASLSFHQQEGVARHRDFLEAKHQEGSLIFGGPFLDDSGGLAVYRADSLDDVHRALASDETVKDGLLQYEIHPYVIAFRSG